MSQGVIFGVTVHAFNQIIFHDSMIFRGLYTEIDTTII